MRIACIVEGHGDVDAVPILLRRLALQLGASVPDIQRPIRVKRDKFVRQISELHRTVELAARKAGESGCVMVLLDADDDCPAKLGPRLLSDISAVRPHMPMSLVLANREFESWFIAAAESCGLPANHTPAVEPESIRGAKEWVGHHILNARYVETRHQPSFSARFDLEAACRASSFDKFRREVGRLLCLHSPL